MLDKDTIKGYLLGQPIPDSDQAELEKLYLDRSSIAWEVAREVSRMSRILNDSEQLYFPRSPDQPIDGSPDGES